MDTVNEIKVPQVAGGQIEGGRSALIQVATQVANMIQSGNDAVKAARTGRESFSGMMVRIALAAIITTNRSAVETALGKGADKKDAVALWTKWQGVKFAFSEAEFLNQFLARHTLPHPKGTKWIIGGNPVDAVTRDHKEALVNNVQDGDGGIRTMVKAARALRKDETAKSDAAGALQAAQIEAFLVGNPALAAEHGLTVESALDDVTDPTYKGPALDVILAGGADLMRQRAEREEQAAILQDRAGRMASALEFLRTQASAEDLEAFAVAYQDRKAEVVAADVPDHAPDHAEQGETRKRAGGRRH